MKEVIFVGDRPSKQNTWQEVAFFGTKSYDNLIKWIEVLGCDGNYKMINSHLSYLLDSAEYEWLRGSKIIALGNEAAKRLNSRGICFHKLPHPSPRNRQLNKADFIKKNLVKLKNILTKEKTMSKEKCQKEYAGFCHEVDSLNADQLKARIVQLQQSIETTIDCKEQDEDLKSARLEALELGAPYRDAIKACRLKTSYLVELLGEKTTEPSK